MSRILLFAISDGQESSFSNKIQTKINNNLLLNIYYKSVVKILLI